MACKRSDGDERIEFAAPKTVLRCPRLPLLAQPRQVDLLLRLARRERSNSGSDKALRPQCLHVLHEQASASGERADDFLRHADELAHAFDRLGPLKPEPAGELVTEMSLVQIAGCEPVCLEDHLAVERPQLAVARAGHVRDDYVRV